MSRKQTKEIRIQHSFSFGTCHCSSCFTSAKVKLETKRNAIKFNPDPIGAQELYDGMEDDFVDEYGDEVLK